MQRQPLDAARLLRALVAHEVRFVVVGGVAAGLLGVPLATSDLDIVHSRDPANIARLLVALGEVNARSRQHLDTIVRPNASHLSGPGHVLLATDAGSLDVLGSAGRGHDFADLDARSVDVDVAGVRVRVLGLESLIQLKEEAGRPKDLGALPTLRATLEEIRRRG